MNFGDRPFGTARKKAPRAERVSLSEPLSIQLIGSGSVIDGQLVDVSRKGGQAVVESQIPDGVELTLVHGDFAPFYVRGNGRRGNLVELTFAQSRGTTAFVDHCFKTAVSQAPAPETPPQS